MCVPMATHRLICLNHRRPQGHSSTTGMLAGGNCGCLYPAACQASWLPLFSSLGCSWLYTKSLQRQIHSYQWEVLCLCCSRKRNKGRRPQRIQTSFAVFILKNIMLVFSKSSSSLYGKMHVAQVSSRIIFKKPGIYWVYNSTYYLGYCLHSVCSVCVCLWVWARTPEVGVDGLYSSAL